MAIDFTQSNGDPANPNSLHFPVDEETNSYLKVLRQFTDALVELNTDGDINAFGFGAEIITPSVKLPSHCFALNGDFFKPKVKGFSNL